MGREAASAFGRWFALSDVPPAELYAVCDVNAETLRWFENVPTVKHRVRDYQQLLAVPEVDVVYVAVPHNLHRELYLAVLQAGKDLFAEKPFGIDLATAREIEQACRESGLFVRCSSEFPFFPGAQRAYSYVKTGEMGRILNVRSGFLHSSDLDPTKPANWKRKSETCGEIGVMGDLGMHVLHLPLRLGMRPARVYAQLQKGYPERPDGRGGVAACDTWDNATLHTEVPIDGDEVPMELAMKRLAPGETNTWYFEVMGTDGGVRFSTKDPKSLWTFRRGKDQEWCRTDVGHSSVFPTVTGGIFEFGFPDSFLQMWGAFIAERQGVLGERFGCVTPAEALASHEVFAAALESHRTKCAVSL